VPFDFLRRRKGEAQGGITDGAAPTGERGVPFDGMTEEWRLVGTMQVDGRLSDAVNRREPIVLSDVQWAPIDGTAPFEPAPGLKTIDPYDLILIMAGQSTLPTQSETEKVAHRVHKVSYDVAIEVPPFRVVGTVFLYPGSDPNRLLDRATEMFVPVVDATASNLYVMPGLIEYHSHLQKDFGEAQGRAWLAFGITTVRSPGNTPYEAAEDREANEAGVRPGPWACCTTWASSCASSRRPGLPAGS